jgi:hypothetical protein
VTLCALVTPLAVRAQSPDDCAEAREEADKARVYVADLESRIETYKAREALAAQERALWERERAVMAEQVALLKERAALADERKAIADARHAEDQREIARTREQRDRAEAAKGKWGVGGFVGGVLATLAAMGASN